MLVGAFDKEKGEETPLMPSSVHTVHYKGDKSSQVQTKFTVVYYERSGYLTGSIQFKFFKVLLHGG